MKFMKPLKKMCLFIALAVVFFFAKGFTAAIVCLIVSGVLFAYTAMLWFKWLFNL